MPKFALSEIVIHRKQFEMWNIFRNILFVFVSICFQCFAAFSLCYAQEQLEASIGIGSADNTATITVTNSEENLSIDNVSLSLSSEPKWLRNIRIESDNEGPLLPGASRVYTIRFDAREDARDGVRETLSFKVSAEMGIVDHPDPKISVVIKQAEEGEKKTADDAGALPVLKLVRIDWSARSMTGVTHKPGGTGYSTQFTSPAGTVRKASYGFTEFPLEILLGKPFEFVLDLASCKQVPARTYDPSGNDFSHPCSVTGVVWTEPVIALSIRAAARTKNFDPEHYGMSTDLWGVINKFTCPSREYSSAVTVSQASQYVLKFVPNGPPTAGSGNAYLKFPYRIEASGEQMKAKSIKALQGKSVTITFHTEHRESNGVRLSVSTAGGGIIDYLALVYGVETADQPGIQATPFKPPAGMSTTTITQGGGPAGPDTGGPPERPGEHPPDVKPPGVQPPVVKPPTTESDKPIDPNTLDPNSHDVAGVIREWLDRAEPPENAVPGNNWRYDKFGRKIGGGTSARSIRTAPTVDYGTGATPEAKVWSALRKKLDSINHCTLEEYVVAKLENQSIEKCRGRYQGIDDLRGELVGNVKDKLDKAGINYAIKEGGGAPRKEKEGTIKKHTPEPNSWFKRGKTVELVIYGPFSSMVTVPDVTDQPFASAKEKLERAGLKFKTSGKPAPSKEKEFTIAAQKPGPGILVKKGQTVELVIYGPAKKTKLTVPDLEGLSLKKAKARLREKGLKSKPSAGKAATSKRQEYTVASQYPTPGTLIKKGQTVELVIFGPAKKATLTVPNLEGLSLKKAKAKLREKGLKSKPSAGKAATSKRQEYTVASQYPTPGSLIKKGQTVEVVIYGPYTSMVTVPDVTRLTADEAMDRLNASGLKGRIRPIGRANSKQWSERVIDMKPAAGTKVAANTEVVISVYGTYAPTKEDLVAQHDCRRYPGTRAYWNDNAGKPGCRCVGGQIWSRKQNRCIRKLSPNEICSRDYPGTSAKGRTSDGKINCVCPKGYVWSKDQRQCVKKSTGGGGRDTTSGQKKIQNPCAGTLAHIKTLAALTNENNREMSNKLIGNDIQQARRDGCSEEAISAVMVGIGWSRECWGKNCTYTPPRQTGRGGGRRTGGGGGGGGEEKCECVDENGRRYHPTMGKECGESEFWRDYNCD